MPSESPAAVLHGRAERSRLLRLRYNRVFLPEYVSTVALSAVIGGLFLGAVRGEPDAAVAPHFAAATALWISLAVVLLRQTWAHRVRFGDVLVLAEFAEDGFAADGDDRPAAASVRVGGRWWRCPELEGVRESVGGFFGRSARVLRLTDGVGRTAEIYESLPAFDRLPALLAALSDRTPVLGAEVEDGQRDRLRAAWRRRHETFPQPGGSEWLNNAAFRALCLIPVAGVDLVLTASLTLLAARLGRPGLAFWVSPVALLTSACIARFVYYYLFTSARLNRRVGLEAE